MKIVDDDGQTDVRQRMGKLNAHLVNLRLRSVRGAVACVLVLKFLEGRFDPAQAPTAFGRGFGSRLHRHYIAMLESTVRLMC